MCMLGMKIGHEQTAHHLTFVECRLCAFAKFDVQEVESDMADVSQTFFDSLLVKRCRPAARSRMHSKVYIHMAVVSLTAFGCKS